MVILDDIKRQLGELAPVVTDLADALAIHQCRMRLDELENKSADPAFYNDPSASGAVFAEMGEIKDKLEDYAKLQGLLSDAQTLLEMCEEDDDPALAEELGESVEVLAEKVEEMRLVTLLTGEYDHNNAILTFHAGAGGTEAQDWSEMLYRMYSRFAARHGFTVKVLDYLDGDEAGLKSASILI
ncbi:MAG: PCRF domain-containing protein, partial [Ruthenibacterium sp.]